MLNESDIIIFCRTIYFDMLSMWHSSKQELNNVFFGIFGGLHVEFMVWGIECEVVSSRFFL